MTEKPPRANFDNDRDSFLLVGLKNQQVAGKRAENGFKKEAWTAVTSAFNLNFELDYSKEQLKARYNQLGATYKRMKELVSQSGFGWDPVLQTVTAPDDVWTEFLKKHPKSAKLRGKPFTNYQDMDAVFKGRGATGKHSMSSSTPKGTKDIDSEVENMELENEDPTVTFRSATPAALPPATGTRATGTPAALPPATGTRATGTSVTLPPATGTRATGTSVALPSATGTRATGTSVALPSATGTRATGTSVALPSATGTRATGTSVALPSTTGTSTSQSRHDASQSLPQNKRVRRSGGHDIAEGLFAISKQMEKSDETSIPAQKTKLEEAMMKAQAMKYLTEDGIIVLGELFTNNDRHAAIFNSLGARTTQIKWLQRNLQGTDLFQTD